MIHVIDNWYIDSDGLNYTVCRKKEAKPDAESIVNGKKRYEYKAVGYYGSMAGAVCGVIDHAQKERTASTKEIIELHEALGQMREISRLVREAVERRTREEGES